MIRIWLIRCALLVVVSLLPLSSLASLSLADGSLPFVSLLEAATAVVALLVIRKLAIDEDREGAVEAVIAATVRRVDRGE